MGAEHAKPFTCSRDVSTKPVVLTHEAIVSAENWHEERDRLVQLLRGIESGEITHVDEEDLRELQATNPENIALLKQRLAQLNARLR